MTLGVCVRWHHENQPQNKHVESTSVTCLDEGSTPSSSTKKENLLQKSNKQNAPIVKRLSVHFVFGGDCLTGMPYLDGKSGSVGVMLFEKYDNLWEI